MKKVIAIMGIAAAAALLFGINEHIRTVKLQEKCKVLYAQNNEMLDDFEKLSRAVIMLVYPRGPEDISKVDSVLVELTKKYGKTGANGQN
ncbi:MAG: hypothetical protein J5706_02430 [Elusimicrobiales bacterium]|nr:hypothetical protein [Elusimicrobiales bacterium]